MRNIEWDQGFTTAIELGRVCRHRAYVAIDIHTGNPSVFLWKRQHPDNGSMWTFTLALPKDTPVDEQKRVILALLALGMDDGE